MSVIFWAAIAYLSGALPFSVWIGRLALRTDIRGYGDRNPGAFNVFRAGGKLWGIVAILLDGFKGAIPIWLAAGWGHLGGWSLAVVAIAPALGHAFSPFLGFRGGKALAVTFGVWCGLTLWFGPTVLGVALAVGLAIFVVPGWAVLFGMLVLLAALLLTQSTLPLLAVWAANTALLAWKHRDDLRQPPDFGVRLPGRRSR